MNLCVHPLAVIIAAAGQVLTIPSEPDKTFGFFEQNPVFMETAIQLDCYFAIEEWDTTLPVNGPQRAAYSRWFTAIKGPYKDVNGLVESLNKALIAAKAFRVSPDSNIVFIVREQALRDQRYVMNQKASLKYNGTPSGCLKKISPSLSVPRIVTFGVPQGDWKTQIAIDAIDLPVRSIVTDYLPLSQYPRLLWVSETDGNFSESWVRFNARVNIDYFEKARRAPEMTLFGRGEVAYYANLHRPQAVAAARDFVETRMKEKDKTQVRWAMFFLGKKKDEASIPLLLKHLDYLYTPSRVLEEAYPALGALSMLGTDVSVPAIDALELAESDLRIHLLARLIANVEGQEAALKAFRRLENRAPDPEIKARFKKARAFLEKTGL